MNLAKRLRKLRKRNRKVAKARRKVHFEPLEPRLLLSADLNTTGVAAVLNAGMDQTEATLIDFFDNEDLLDTRVPLVVEAEASPEGDVLRIAPSLRELLEVPVDYDQDGSPDFGLETYDTGDGEVELVDDILKPLVFDKIATYLTSGGPYSNGALVSTIEGLDVSGGGGDFGFDLTLSGVSDTSNDNQVSFSFNFDLTLSQQLTFDLGTFADDYAISTGAETGFLPIDVNISFTMEFGVLTSDETPVNSDFFIDATPIALEFDIGGTSLSFLDMRVGFLGVEVTDGEASVEADIEAPFTDPSSATKLGFTSGQFGTASTGSITAGSAFAEGVSGDVSLFIRIDNGGDGDAQEVRFSLAGATLGNIVGKVQTAVDAVFTSSEISVSLNGSNQLVLTLNTGTDITVDSKISYSDLSTEPTDELLPASAVSSDVTVDFTLNAKSDADFSYTGTFPTSTLYMSASDLFALTGPEKDVDGNERFGLQFTPDTGFDEMLQFSGISSGSVISMLRQLGTWLGNYVREGDFAGYNIPLTDAPASEVLDLNDVLTDGLIYDDNDTDDIDGDDDDTDKLLANDNDTLVPVFNTAQKLADALDDLDIASTSFTFNGANYDIDTDLLTYDIQFSHTLDYDVPAAFSLDLAPLLDIESDATVTLTVDAGLNFVFGFDLGAADTIDMNTELSTLNRGSGVEIKQEVAVTAPEASNPIYGRISDDATFSIDGTPITIAKIDTDSISTVGELAALIQAELVGPLSDITATAVGNRILLSRSSAFTLTADTSDPAHKELGFPDSADAELSGGDHIMLTRRDVPVIVGRLADAVLEPDEFAEFQIVVDPLGADDTYDVSLNVDNTVANRTIIDLINDVTNALKVVDDGISPDPVDITNMFDVSAQGLRLVISAKESSGITDFTIQATNTHGENLGFDSTATVHSANGDDFIIYTSDGTPHYIDLDGLDTVDGTPGDPIILQDVKTAIENQTGSAVTVPDTLTINPDGNGLQLEEAEYPNGSDMFRVEATNGSPAALQLGILRSDTATSTVDPDGSIEGGSLGGTTMADRFFINVNGGNLLDADVTLSGSEMTADAKFGIVDVDLSNGAASLTANVTATLLDGKITMTELSTALSDVIATPSVALTSPGSLSFDVAVNPSIPSIPSLTGGSIAYTIDDLGDPFAETVYMLLYDSFTVDGDETSTLTKDLEVTTTLGSSEISSVSYNDTANTTTVSLADAILNVTVTEITAATLPTPTTYTESGNGFDVLIPPDSFNLGGDETDVLFAGLKASTTLGSAQILSTSYDVVTDETTVTLTDDIQDGTVTDITINTPVPPTVTPTTSLDADLLKFADLGVADLVSSMDDMETFVADLESMPELSTKLPIINMSVSELINFSEPFAGAAAYFRENPPATLQELEAVLNAAFGAPTGTSYVDLELVSDGGMDFLKISLDLSRSFSRGVNIAIPDLIEYLNLGPLGEFVDLDLIASAGLQAFGNLDLDLAFGLSLDVATPEVYVFDETYSGAETGIHGHVELDASTTSGLNFYAGLGPVSLTVSGGEVSLTADVTAELDEGSTYIEDGKQALFSSLISSPLNPDAVARAIAGTAGLNLPVFFPTEDDAIGSISLPSVSFTEADILEAFDGLDATAVINAISAKDFSDYNLFDNMPLGVDGLEMFLGSLDSLLGDQLQGLAGMPVIGDLIDQGVDFLRDVADDLVEPLRDLIAKADDLARDFADPSNNPVSEMLYNILEPTGLLLDSSITPTSHPWLFEDVVGGIGWDQYDDFQGYYTGNKIGLSTNMDDFLYPGVAPGPTPDISDVFVQWNLTLGEIIPVTDGVDFDLGLAGLGLETSKPIAAELGLLLNFGIGLSLSQGFYVDLNLDPDLAVYFKTVLDEGTTVSGSLGFLEFTADTKPIDLDDDQQAVDQPYEGIDDIGNTRAGVALEINLDPFVINPTDPGGLGLEDLMDLEFDARVSAQAQAGLGLEFTMGDTFPKITADLVMDWRLPDTPDTDLPESFFAGTFGSTFLTSLDPFGGSGYAFTDLTQEFLDTLLDNPIGTGLNLVELQNIVFDSGTFIENIIKPILDDISEYTSWAQPFIDVITAPIPVISDLVGPTTLLDIAEALGFLGPLGPGTVDFIYEVCDIVTMINTLAEVESFDFSLLFGNLPLYNPKFVTEQTPGGLTPQFWEYGSIDNLLNDQEFKNLLEHKLVKDWDDIGSQMFTDLDTWGLTEVFEFPIFEDVSEVIGLLFGQDAVLIAYDMPKLDFRFEYSQFFPIFGPLGASINGEIFLTIDLAFGYDTFGVRRYYEGDFQDTSVLESGFFISDTDLYTGDYGTDVPELVFGGGLWAAAEVNIAVARAGVAGGLFVDINFDLHDPNRDGRVRLEEIEWNIEVADNFLAMFDLSGEFYAKLFAFLKVDCWLFEIKWEKNITPPITILEYNYDFDREAKLANEGEGFLIINAGQFAQSRLEGSLADDGETFTLTKKDASTITVEHVDTGQTQDHAIDPGETIIISGGAGNDTFNLYGLADMNVVLQIDGGTGDDRIYLTKDDESESTSATAVIYGGEGNDIIYGGSGNDRIIGEDGNDELHGGGGDDLVVGDTVYIYTHSLEARTSPRDGDDEIYGDDGHDILIGGGGEDEIYGGGGDDDNDAIFGDGVKLTFNLDMMAGNIADIAHTVWGTGYTDELHGGTQNDLIYGGGGDDIIYGEAGDDVLFGEDGIDTVYGGENNDIIYGDRGDPVDTNTDSDYDLYDEFGRLDLNYEMKPYGDGQADVLFGGSGDDTMFGSGGNDEMYANENNDTLFGGSGADLMSGGPDNDTLYGQGQQDILLGGAGADKLDGGDGRDFLFGEYGPLNIEPTSAYDGIKDYKEAVYGSNLPDWGPDEGFPTDYSYLSYLFGTTYSNPADPILSMYSEFDDTLISGDGSDFLDGQYGQDDYKIYLQGADNQAFINVYDSGPDDQESDFMHVMGTMYDDTFLLRKSASQSGLSFVALLNDDPYTERINYWSVEDNDPDDGIEYGGLGLERMLVSGLFGEDYFAVDDVGTETTLEGNEDEDTFQVGQLYRSPRDYCAWNFNHIESKDGYEDFYATIETTVGWLSDGINQPMTVYGGTGNDRFTVFHNKAVLSLFGEDGDDTFLIKAFALAGSQEPVRERTDISGGAGVDLVQYAMNAPVNIDGGDGFDRVIVIGTEFGDDFVVTKDGVYGAGLNVNFVNIESLAVDGAEGDDRFYVRSTGEDLITELFGGLGSDTFNMSGDSPPIISNDLQGHSGIITHEIEMTQTSPSTNYDHIPIDGLAVNVYDNDTADPQVIIRTPLGMAEIMEGDYEEYYYEILLAAAPEYPVSIQVMAPVQTSDQQERKAKMFGLSSPDGINPEKDRTSLFLEFDATNWYTPQKVYISAPDLGSDLGLFESWWLPLWDLDPDTLADLLLGLDYDDSAIEGDCTGFINHVVTTSTSITGSPDTVTVVEYPEDPVYQYKTYIYDAENEATFDSYYDSASETFALQGYMLQITDGPGAGQSIRIIGYDPGTHELIVGGKFRECEGSVIGADSVYKITRDIKANRALEVLVRDNDKAAVVANETEDSTVLFEAGADDTIAVRLARQPDDVVTVSLASNDGQLSFSATTLTFSDEEGDLNAWNIPQVVTVTAVDDIDDVREGFHHGLISFSTSSSDADTPVTVPDETIQLVKEQSYAALMNRPAVDDNGDPLVASVTVNGDPWPDPYEVVSNKIVFLREDGADYAKVIGQVIVEYTYDVEGYDKLIIDPVLTDIADDDVAQVKITPTLDSTDVIEFTGYDQSFTQNNTVFSPNVLVYNFDVSDFSPTDDGLLTITAFADLDLDTKYLNINVESLVNEEVFVTDGEQLSTVTDTIAISLSDLGVLTADSTVTITVTPSSAVADLGESELTLNLSFPVDDLAGFPNSDTYEVVLTQGPAAEVQVRVTPEITKTSAGRVIHWGQQVAVTSEADGAGEDGDDVILTFSANELDANAWNIPQIVTVYASGEYLYGYDEYDNPVIKNVDDDWYDGDDTQYFAPQLHTVSDIQGPLYLYGEGGNGSIVAFEPVMLHYELNIMPPTDDVDEVGEDGTTITVDKETILDAAAAINREIDAGEWTVQDLVDQHMTITLAEGFLEEGPVLDEDDDPIFIKEIGQFRLITGADDNGTTVTLTLNEAWDLTESWDLTEYESYEMITKYRLTQMSLNFFADETEQIDYVFVYNEESPADNEILSRQGFLTDATTAGTDTSSTGNYFAGNTIVEEFANNLDGKWLYGFGMGAENLFLAGSWHPRGITYGDVEVVEINLGYGNDIFTIDDTHSRADGFQTWTIVNTGGGDDIVNVSLDSVAEILSGASPAFDVTIDGESNSLPGAYFSDFGTDELAGRTIEVVDGTGTGITRDIVSNNATSLVVDSAWGTDLDETTVFLISSDDPEIESFNVKLGSIPASSNTIEGDFSGFTSEELVGHVIEIVDGAGDGTRREIVGYSADELTVSSSWNSVLDDTTVYNILGDVDGRIAINTQEGVDTVNGSESTIPLILFGGDDTDTLTGGSVDDIIFGDKGRVEFVNEADKIVTLLGVMREWVDPRYVTDYGDDYLVDSPDTPPPEYPAVDFPVETIDQQGLVGLTVSITDGAGFRQSPRLITANDSTTLWVSPDWEYELNPDPFGDFDSINPDTNPSKYRISTVPEDQTDGVVRDAKLIIATDPDIGDDDFIYGNEGNDRIFGGAADDTIEGNDDNDIIFGDHGRLDYTPETVGNAEEGPALGDVVPATLWRVRTTFDGIGGADTVHGDQDNDIILGGYNPNEMNSEDNLFGNTDDDIILGDNGALIFSPNTVTANDPRDVYLDVVYTISGEGGVDIISGNGSNDIAMGGTAGDTMYGDDATASANLDDGEDVLLGDNGLITLSGNVLGRLNAFGSGVNLIQTTDTTDVTGGSDTIEGNAAADVIMGGVNGDVLYGDAAASAPGLDGDDVVLGDNGTLHFEFTDFDPTSLDEIFSSPGYYFNVLGGEDTISGNAGNDTIFGGTYGDTIYGDDATASGGALDGEDIVIADNGNVSLSGVVSGRLYVLNSAVNRIRTTDNDEVTGGSDTVEGNAKADVILGGVNGDELYGDAAISVPSLDGDDVILGDNGWLDFEDSDIDPSTLDLVHSEAYASDNTTVLGGDDTISGNAGNDTIIGGTYNDTMYGYDATASGEDSDGEEIMLGDNADITLSGDGTGRLYILNSIVSVIDTTDYETMSGGQDTISGNAGIDFIAGGTDRDTIYGDAASPDAQYDGDDYILGDNGIFEFELGQDDVGDLGRPDVLTYLGGTTLSLDPDPTTLDRVMITDPTLGDDDTIHGDAGNDTIFGGTGRDKIWGDSDMDNQIDNATDGDGTDIIFGDHAKIYPHLPNDDSFFINNNFFSINTSEDDGFDTDGVVEYAPGTDFEDIIFGSGNDDTIIGGQDDDILIGGADNDILIGGHNVVGGQDEIDDMDAASIKAILPDVLADLDSSDVNDVNDVMDGGSQNDVMAGDNAIIIRQNGETTSFLVNSQSPRYQLLAEGETEIYSMVTETMGGLYDIDVGFEVNIDGTPQLKPGSDVGYTVILLNHTEATQTLAAQNPTAPRVFGNDVMAGGSEDDEMFGQLGDDIMQGDGSIDMVSDTTGWQMPDGTTPFDPSPAVDPSFIIPDNQTTPTRFMVEGDYLLFHSDEAGTDGDDYMEGNAGNDRMYGNLGQDDMIGGNSTLFGLDEATAQFYGMQPDDFPRPDGADLIYGGAGDPDRLARNAEIDPATGDGAVPADQNHGRDADVVLGDNGNIYRLVQVDGETEYLTFNYDQITAGEALTDGYSTDRPIIPRAVEFLDYAYSFTFDGTEVSATFAGVGYGDLIYGETGDDIIHGMTGDDTLFGNGDDDDLYGEVGNDWISGGTGEDGILGDDGLILTSRNDTNDEPLYGIVALDATGKDAEINREISTPGNIQRAIINVEDTLKKTVDLISFNLEGDGIPVNDILYGGLNDDWMHAGQGDDAMSGGEALPFYYTNETVEGLTANQLLQIQQEAPVNPGLAPEPNPFWFDFAPYNPGDILRYEGNTAADPDDPHGKTKQEFALYDEFLPRRKVMLDVNGEAVALAADAVYDFLLNFNEDEGPLGYHYLGDDAAMQTDGDDRMFGDLGNDWMVGGTGRDHMYGGRGDDLLNMDDNHDSGPGGKTGPHDPPTDPLDNTQSDEYQAYADIAYGGAGRDVLILNTGADRAIDWVGEYNSYIVPFSPFGAFHISRTLQPQLPEFLYDLSESDGIDMTVPDGARYVEQKTLDVRVDVPDPLRHGEPFGELGMVRQPDFDWQDQTGAPNDPQPGNLQGQREIMRRELFTDTEPVNLAFAPDVGIWTLADGCYKGTIEVLFGDAVSIYHLDMFMPSYMEVLATVNISKAIELEGLKKRDAEELSSANAYIIFDYVDETNFKFAGLSQKTNKVQIGHRTPDGWVIDINWPMQLRANTDYDLTLVMYGTVATIWVDEQVSLSHDFGVPLNNGYIGLGSYNATARFDDFQVQKLPPDITFEFPEDFANAADNPFVSRVGDWNVVNGEFVGMVNGDSDRAVATQSLDVAPYSRLEMEVTIRLETLGGIVFDCYSPEEFKFAALRTDTHQVIIGHYTSKQGWSIDAEADYTVDPDTGYTLGVSLFGTTASVTVNGEAIAGHMFNSLLNDGDFGLLSRDGASMFDDFVVRGDDPAYAEDTGEALTASTKTQSILNLPAGWSMISLPVIPDNPAVSALFPDAVVVYGYEKGKGYVREDTMEVGKGYWVLFNEAQDYILTGQPIQEYPSSVDSDGWDMIGGGTNSVTVQTLAQKGKKIDVIYEYVPGRGYQRILESENLKPGKGYWIRWSPVQTENTLTEDALSPIVDEAIARWAEALGSDSTMVAEQLPEVTFQIVDLEGLTLGRAIEDKVLIDINAAGHGWFVDETPYDDGEFGIELGDGEMLATADSQAYGQMDLLTAVMHEFGHVLGLEDLDPETHDVMSATLDASVRRLPGDGDIAALSQEGDGLKNGSPNLVVMDVSEEPDEGYALAAAVAPTQQSPWLRQFLLNAGQADDVDPNAEIRVVIPRDEDI